MSGKGNKGRNGGQTVPKEDRTVGNSSGSAVLADLACEDSPSDENDIHACFHKDEGNAERSRANKPRDVKAIDLPLIHPRYRRHNKGLFPFKDRKIKEIAASTDRYNRRRSAVAEVRISFCFRIFCLFL